MSYTLVGWRNSTTLLVVQHLPLQTNQSASALSATYLSDNGGWNPIDEDDSTGLGEPVNGDTPEQAALAITAIQLEKMYEITATENVTIRLKYNTNFVPDQLDTTILASSRDEIEAIIDEQLKDTILEVVSIENESSEIVNRGLTTQADRKAIQQDIDSSEKLIDPKAIALSIARNLYLLDKTHNVVGVYSETDTDLVIMINKYRDTEYAVLDSTALKKYVLSLNATSYTLSTGIVLPL